MNHGNRADHVSFTEDLQRQLFLRLTRKSAKAAGIQAMATLAMNESAEGDMTALERIAALAAELVEGLDDLSSLAGQISAAALD